MSRPYPEDDPTVSPVIWRVPEALYGMPPDTVQLCGAGPLISAETLPNSDWLELLDSLPATPMPLAFISDQPGRFLRWCGRVPSVGSTDRSAPTRQTPYSRGSSK